MFVIILIAVVAFVTNMLIMKGQDSIVGVTWLDNYRREVNSNGMVTLDPYMEIKNTIIILHDY